MSDMPNESRRRLFDLRCRSKRGEYLRPEDITFLDDCWKRWPIQYASMSGLVFEETKPFGSNTPSDGEGEV